MNAGSIWWGQIGNSLRLLTKVTNSLRDCQSAVLQVPRNLPWRQDFYGAVDIRRSAFSGERRLMRLQWEENADPGEVILDELCSGAVRAEYWPGQTYAEYLGSRNDILLNDYYVWITGVHSKTDAGKWAEFIARYDRAARQSDSSAVFIVEYDGPLTDLPGVEKIVYTVENYDCRVFCLEMAVALCNAELRTYQAELAACISGSDPEVSSVLLEQGDRLLLEPVQTAVQVLNSGASSEGVPFHPQSEQQINSAVWKASIGLLFPLLEQYRLDFIAAHEKTLARHLPLHNSNGDRITDPFDLEIGPLQYIVSFAGTEFSPEERETLMLCHRTRNLLAHNKLVPYTDVKKILAL